MVARNLPNSLTIAGPVPQWGLLLNGCVINKNFSIASKGVVYFYVYECFACAVYVHHVCALCLGRSGKDAGSARAELQMLVSHHVAVLEEQPTL